MTSPTKFNPNAKPLTRAVHTIVVHCSATKPSLNVDAKMIDRWHREKGWAGIGYHFVIRRDGVVEVGRDWNRVGSHVAGHNTGTLGVCMAGGVDDHGKADNNFTAAQFNSLENLLVELVAHTGATKIQGHRDFPKVAKACPSFDVRAWLKTTLSFKNF